MALIDIGKIKESVEKSADEIKKSLTEAAEKLPDPAKDSISQSMKAMAEKYQNMLDSLIQSEVASMIPVITETYHSSKSEG